MQEEKNSFVREVAEKKYEHGFTTDVYTEIIDKGLNEDIIRIISAKKNEPDWMLDIRKKLGGRAASIRTLFSGN